MRHRDPSWDSCRLSEIIARLDGGVSVLASDSPCDNGHPGVLKVSAVYDGRFFPEENKAVLNGRRPATGLAIEPGDLLISRANTPDLVGACGIARTAHPNLYPPDKLWKVRLADPDRDSVEWLALVLCSPDVRTELRTRASGTGRAMKNISKEAFLAISVGRPPRDAQDAIVRVLKPFADLDELLDRLIGAKGHLRDGLAQALLTGRRRLPAFAGREWREERIGENLSESREPGSHGRSARKLTVRLYGKGVIPKQNGKGGSAKTRYYTRRAGQLIYSKLDFLNGAFGLVPRELDSWESTLDLPAFDIGDEIDPRFLLGLCVLPSFYRSHIGLARGGRKARRVPPEDFLSIKVKLPKRDEQAAIADILDAGTREIDALMRLREAVAKQKRGLMQQLLTGRLRVPEVSDA